MSLINPESAFQQLPWLADIAIESLCERVDLYKPADFVLEKLLQTRPRKLPLRKNLPPPRFLRFFTREFSDRIYLFDRDGEKIGTTGSMTLDEHFSGKLLERIISCIKVPFTGADIEETIGESLNRQYLPIDFVGYVVIIRPVEWNQARDLIDTIWIYKLFNENNGEAAYNECPSPFDRLVVA